LLNSRGIFPEKIIILEEVVALCIVFVPLEHVEYVEAEHLVVEEPAVMVMEEMLCPNRRTFNLPTFLVINVSYPTRKEPGVCIDEYLLRRIVFTCVVLRIMVNGWVVVRD